MTAASGAAYAGAFPARTDAQIRDQLLSSLEQRILTEAAGALVPTGVRLPGRPQMAWLGQLASEPQLIADSIRGLSGDRLVPAAEGFSFRLPATGTPLKLDLTLSFSVYVALHPTLAEQRAFINADSEGDETGAPRGGYGAVSAGSAQGRQLAVVWAKVPVGPVPLHVSIELDGQGFTALRQRRNRGRSRRRRSPAGRARAIPHSPPGRSRRVTATRRRHARRGRVDGLHRVEPARGHRRRPARDSPRPLRWT